MHRIKIDLPKAFSFQTKIPIRITDLNYGNHVGNDTILSILHEARVQYLEHYGYEELNFGGVGLIMSNVEIEFKNELFYGDTIIAFVTATGFSKASFDIYYKLEREAGGNNMIVVLARTGMVCYDYAAKKIAAVPPGVKEALTG